MAGSGMVLTGISEVEELAPDAAFDALNSETSAALIDVRTKAEWAFTGVPDVSSIGKPLWLIEWVTYPSMMPNPEFLDELAEKANGTLPEHMLFLCRTGGRSLHAAYAVAQSCAAIGSKTRCTNVAEGFEGDLDTNRHRGTRNGWKGRGLPWIQS